MKYLFINVVAGIGSTGRIAAEKCRELQAQGHECVLAYGRAENGCEGIRTHRIGTDRDIKLHGLMTRTLDLNGFCSTKATKEFVQWIREYDPDVIWLHNIHGYYLNVEVLFDYLKSCGKPIKWTLHDCWSFTGHCAYFRRWAANNGRPAAANAHSWVPTRPAKASAMWHATTPAKRRRSPVCLICS